MPGTLNNQNHYPKRQILGATEVNNSNRVHNNTDVDGMTVPNAAFNRDVPTYPDNHPFYSAIDTLNQSGAGGSSSKYVVVGPMRYDGTPATDAYSQNLSKDLIILSMNGVAKVLEKDTAETYNWDIDGPSADGFLYYTIDISDFENIDESYATLAGAVTVPLSDRETIYYPIAYVTWDSTNGIIDAIQPIQFENIVITKSSCILGDEIWTTVIPASDDDNCDVMSHIGPDTTADLLCTILLNPTDPGGSTLADAHLRIDELYDTMSQAAFDSTGHLIKFQAKSTDSNEGDESTGGVKYLWKKCSDDSEAATFDAANNPTHDYAYICLSSVYTTCYQDGFSLELPVHNPCALEGETVPTSCGTIAEINASDAFDGEGTASTTKGDCYYNARFTDVIAGTGVTTLQNNQLRLKIEDPGGTYSRAAIDEKTSFGSSNFTFYTNYNDLTLVLVARTPGSTGSYADISLRLEINSTRYEIGVGDLRNAVSSMYGIMYYDGSSWNQHDTDIPTSGKLEFVRTGTSLAFKVDGVTIHTATVSGSCTLARVAMEGRVQTSDGAESYVDIEELIALDGSGDPITFDPTGDSC